jgi:hypothetical protein
MPAAMTFQQPFYPEDFMSRKSMAFSALVAVAVMAASSLTFGGGGPGGGSPGGGGPGGGRMGGGAGGPGGAGGAPMGGRGGARGGAPANLEGAMGGMNNMLRAIKAEAADETKIEQTLKDLAQFERDVAIAKMQTPSTNKVEEAKKANAAADYRTAMTSIQRTLLDLEDAVAAKKADEVKKLIAKLDDIEKAGHAEFGVGR